MTPAEQALVNLQAYNRGYRSYLDHGMRQANPHAAGTAQHTQWERGRVQAAAHVARRDEQF